MTASEKSHDEQLLVYNVLSSPSDELYLLAPKSSDDGESLFPSKIITKIENELFDMERENVNDDSEELRRVKNRYFWLLEPNLLDAAEM